MTETVQKKLEKQLEAKEAVVAVMGLGYVGLPLATVFAKAGFKVIGIDPIAEKVEMINRGESYVLDVPAEEVKELVAAGKLKATSDFGVLKEVEAVSICVPTPLRKTGDPDLSYIISAAEELAPHVHRGW